MKNKKLKRNFFKQTVIFMVVFVICSLVSCADPSPLTGTWADNRGDQIMLMADGSFSAVITDSTGMSVRSEGSYTVLLNAITFTTAEGHQVVSEWDIRGNMLYLTWTDTIGNPISLTLYKTRN